jgi:alpha/beta superfamily hydrolase
MIDGATELFLAGDHMLEGIFEEGNHGRSWGGVVVAHPHPLYGGTMAQPVVYRVAKTCREHDLSTLRFNFPGVGKSGGHYSGADEYLDVQAALAHLQERLGGLPSPSSLPLGLAGYSFGSVMAALACTGPVPVDALALIAFPASWYEKLPTGFDGLRDYRKPVLAVCGEDDDIAPAGPLERLLSGMGLDFRLEVLPGAGHLFEETRKEVGRLVAEFMAEALGRRSPAR